MIIVEYNILITQDMIKTMNGNNTIVFVFRDDNGVEKMRITANLNLASAINSASVML